MKRAEIDDENRRVVTALVSRAASLQKGGVIHAQDIDHLQRMLNAWWERLMEVAVKRSGE